jgi:hypothetical protein
MGSSAFDLVLVPVLWGTVGGIGAGTVLLYAMQGVEAVIKKCSSAARSMESATQNSREPLPVSTEALPVAARSGHMDECRTRNSTPTSGTLFALSKVG